MLAHCMRKPIEFEAIGEVGPLPGVAGRPIRSEAAMPAGAAAHSC
jgi:hypothetical protein